MRSSAARARSIDDGSGGGGLATAPLREVLLVSSAAVTFASALRSSGLTGISRGSDTTVQRIAVASVLNSTAVKTCVPSGTSGFAIVTGDSNSGV